MQQTFNQLVTIVFRHKYYRDDLFRSLEVFHSEDTANLLRNLGIVLKYFPGGLHILTTNPDFLKGANDIPPIRLYLYCKDPKYINYTVLPSYRPTDKILYFNNLSVGDGEEAPKLHQHNHIGQEDVVALSHGRLVIDNFDPEELYYFKDAFGRTIPKEYIAPLPNEPGTYAILDVPEGIIQLDTATKTLKRIYYSPQRTKQTPFGVVELFAEQLFTHYTNNGKPAYTLDFDTRETIWKYFFVGPVYQKFDNLSIINGGKEQLFGTPQKLKVQDKESLMFESSTTLSLSEFSSDSFQLVNDYDPKLRLGKVVVKALPIAVADQLFYDDEDSKESIYSHIYI